MEIYYKQEIQEENKFLLEYSELENKRIAAVRRSDYRRRLAAENVDIE